ncbi:MAG: 4'-phosphopantetheinyl transferase superfamily protein [Clostridia bacterium]|nr:4'-phosphopantetheinyl transferase superfamily protein [Clostridia bacterium]
MTKLFIMRVPQNILEKVKGVFGTKAMSVLSGELASRIGSAELGTSELVTLSHRPSGEPFFENHEQLFVSITHSDNIACIAISDNRIGIDAELIKDYRESVLNRAYNAHEKKQVLSSGDKEAQNRTFYEIWTKKEAVAKSIGEGLNRVLMTSVCDEYGPIYTYVSPNKKKFYLKTYTDFDDCIISVSSANQLMPKSIAEIPVEACELLAEAVV